MRITGSILPISLLAVASVAGAQQRPPIRQLGPITAKSTEVLGAVSGLRALSTGRVLVNDMPHRRILMFDPSLGSFTVIADSTSATANAYSGNFGGLLGYKGDSTIFVDPVALSMLVFDANGKVARVMSVPRSQDAMMLVIGTSGVDASGKMVYRAPPNLARPTFGPNGTFTMPDIPDSAAIVRIDVASRQLDTLGFIKTQKVKLDISRDDNGGMRITTQTNPLPVVDDWAVLSDGSVAFVRGRDYHVDIVKPDGTRLSATKVPFDWQRLTDEDKVAFLDSLKAARARMGANAPTIGLGGGAAPAAAEAGAAAGARAGAAAGGSQQTVVIGGGLGGDGGGRGGPGNANIRMGNGPGGSAQLNFVPASELPDYKPPFFANSTRADLQGNLWIRTIPTKAIPGGPVYDVIDAKGALIDRVQVPANRTIVGFGPDGAVYLAVRNDTTVYLEKAKLR
jgi:hypothetical protein